MPLRDHFHPPLSQRLHWESFYSNWATRIADHLNDKWLSPEFLAEEYTVFPDVYEVRVSSVNAGRKLVGALELVSPGNKERLRECRAFAAKCASYLHRDISLVIIDIVTNHNANLHNETVRLIQEFATLDLLSEMGPYAVAYRTATRGDRNELDVWTEPCSVGQPLPTMPLRLTGDLFVPVEFEVSYEEACRKRRLA